MPHLTITPCDCPPSYKPREIITVNPNMASSGKDKNYLVLNSTPSGREAEIVEINPNIQKINVDDFVKEHGKGNIVKTGILDYKA